jgi:hypothetical protein
MESETTMYGYYVFVGRGDWGSSRLGTMDPTFGGNVATSILGDWGRHRRGTSLAEAPGWSSAWSPVVWRRHIDFLVDRLGADTLALLMNGYELPYSSARFPQAVERDHANVRDEFLQGVLDHARARGLALAAQFCTTGHAETYAALHPECTTVAADGRRHPTNLCHHHPLGRAYAEGVAEEVLRRYRGFSGVSFHPPENAVPCCCACCRAAFETETGRPFEGADPKDVSDFYWASCLAFQRRLEELATSIVPGVRIFSVTIPGRFEQDFDVVAGEIPQNTTFLHWDYWSFGERVPELLRSLRLFGSRGHRVVFVPSSGWSLDRCGPDYGACVVEQIEAARRIGVRDVIYFVGAIWHEPSLLATSWKLQRPSGSR